MKPLLYVLGFVYFLALWFVGQYVRWAVHQ